MRITKLCLINFNDLIYHLPAYKRCVDVYLHAVHMLNTDSQNGVIYWLRVAL